MENIKKELIEFYKKDNSVKLSKNIWLDLLGHALIGLTVGTIIFFIRDTNPMPTILLCTIATTLIGLRNHLKKNK